MTALTSDLLRPADGAAGRISRLVDPGSFVALGSQRTHQASAFGLDRIRPPGDGVVTGTATIGGRPVYVYAQDRRVLGGSLGEAHADKIARTITAALRGGAPVVGLHDSGGARIQEGVAALDGYARVFRANVAASGRVPQIAVILGPCAGGATYSPALMDFVIMTRQASMFLTGPRVVRAVTGEDVDTAALGGPDVHGRRSGCAHLVATDDDHALRLVRELLSYLPSNCTAPLPHTEPAPPAAVDLRRVVPADARRPYDVRDVIRGLVDGGELLELQASFAPNLVVGFARLDGRPVGIIANQPRWLAGVLDIDASDKGARFVRFCDAFGIPLVVLVDVPGFLPGSGQESGGIIRHGAKLVHAFAAATVPRITVVLRKAYGGAYIVMNSRALGADAVLAWPGAELAVMGPEGAVDILFRRQLEADPDARDGLIARYREEAMTVAIAAERGSVDEIIAPEDTRPTLVALLRALCGTPRTQPAHDVAPV